MATRSSLLENHARNFKIMMFPRTHFQMLLAPMKQLQSLKRLRIFWPIPLSTHFWVQRFQRAYFFMVRQEQERLCLLAQLLAKQKFPFIQFLALILLKCLLALVHHVSVISSHKQKRMLQQLSLLMKLMLSVVNVVLEWVAVTMSANKHLTSYLLRWMALKAIAK